MVNKNEKKIYFLAWLCCIFLAACDSQYSSYTPPSSLSIKSEKIELSYADISKESIFQFKKLLSEKIGDKNAYLILAINEKYKREILNSIKSLNLHQIKQIDVIEQPNLEYESMITIDILTVTTNYCSPIQKDIETTKAIYKSEMFCSKNNIEAVMVDNPIDLTGAPASSHQADSLRAENIYKKYVNQEPVGTAIPQSEKGAASDVSDGK
jgi:hypothetical protein